MKQSRKQYNKAFKIMAVELHRIDMSFTEVSQSFAVEDDMLRSCNIGMRAFKIKDLPIML
jgi:hypothetical protein